MSLGDTLLEIVKVHLLPEIREMKDAIVAQNRKLDAMVTRQETAEARFDQVDQRFDQVDQRFDLVDKRFNQIDQRIEQQGIEHSRRMDLLDKRIERLESSAATTNDRLAHLTDAVGRLTLLGDYVRRMDELAAEVRELKRRMDDEVLPRLPKTGT